VASRRSGSPFSVRATASSDEIDELAVNGRFLNRLRWFRGRHEF
jgi:hypothetical protein